MDRLNPPAIDRLHEILQPVQIISGALDVPEFVRLSELLAESIPTAKRIEIPGTAHMVTDEQGRKTSKTTDYRESYARSFSIIFDLKTKRLILYTL